MHTSSRHHCIALNRPNLPLPRIHRQPLVLLLPHMPIRRRLHQLRHDRHRAALARELDRVAAQVRDDLPQPDLVADDPEALVGRGRVRAEANLVDVGVEFDREGDAFGGGGDLNMCVR